ncbi:MAG TPA: hypothetical protein PK597_06760, partial [Oscillospiraceae bacterium]|nr:hypothetical protein [Oscillospiraceae bacterium]
TRFRKVLHGFDPAEVTSCLKEQKAALEELRAALEAEKTAREEERCTLEAQLEERAAETARDKAALSGMQDRLAAAQEKLRETERREQAALARQAQDAAAIESLRASSGAQAAEHLRAQLIAASRESSEAEAQLLAVRQKNKQLSARLDALTAEYDALSRLYAEAREKSHRRETRIVRDAARMRSLSRYGAVEAAQRLQETAELIAACFHENETLLSRLDGEAAPPEAEAAQPETEDPSPAQTIFAPEDPAEDSQVEHCIA